MDDILELLLKNPSLSVRFDTFEKTRTMRVKFMFEGKAPGEYYVKLPGSDPDGGFILRQGLGEIVQAVRSLWKLK